MCHPVAITAKEYLHCRGLVNSSLVLQDYPQQSEAKQTDTKQTDAEHTKVKQTDAKHTKLCIAQAFHVNKCIKQMCISKSNVCSPYCNF